MCILPITRVTVLRLRSLRDLAKWDLMKRAGKTRFDRLYLIGSTSSFLHLEALKGAIAEAKRGKDISRYGIAVATLREIAPTDPDATPDLGWIERMNKQAKAETDRLELELKGYKNNLIKESIRVCLCQHQIPVQGFRLILATKDGI